ncbi:MAG TPA: hypothetical protein VK524_13510, partial [Polyangiaceae bacterium]|nr:hypothetical protein [Polyangiaceae bacterium]
GPDPRRGANIGAVLVNAADEPVCWARQAVNLARDATRHAEVTLITTYLRETAGFTLRGHRDT